MRYYIIIPAHNEEEFLTFTLQSILEQSLLPEKVIIVNDNSSDGTEKIIDQFVGHHTIFTKLNTKSSNAHMPGSKVINAFHKGMTLIDGNYDFIVKLDADLILPKRYFKSIADEFKISPELGIVGGFVYERSQTDEWKLNHPMNKKHVRGAFKAYSKACFKAIGGLRSAMGWDTLDELLAQYHGFELKTLDHLKVKHLRPTGDAYSPKAKLLQGKAMYLMGYGFTLTLLASIKMAFKQRKPIAIYHNLKGFMRARRSKEQRMVTQDEADFIRSLRWRGITRKIFGTTKKAT